MKKSEEIKEQIISATINLIEQGNGSISEITTRIIAQNVKIGVGLINYHFQTKDNLIEICVQRIINKTVSNFVPENKNYLSDTERLTGWATQVFDFLFANPAVSRISILGDLNTPSLTDNSVKTMKGFANALTGNLDEKEKNILVFALVSVMQAAFIRKEFSLELLGCDLNCKAERDEFIASYIGRININSKLSDGVK